MNKIETIIKEEFMSGFHPLRYEGETWEHFLSKVFERGYELGKKEAWELKEKK